MWGRDDKDNMLSNWYALPVELDKGIGWRGWIVVVLLICSPCLAGLLLNFIIELFLFLVGARQCIFTT